MALNPEIYKPSKKDNAWHSAPYEWWYFDGIFDNGYAMWNQWLTGDIATWGAAPEPRNVVFLLCPPDGKLMATNTIFPLHETSASAETCDVKYGANYIRGGYPKWELHYRSGDIGADLVYENLTQGVREPPDACCIGRIQEPATLQYVTWVLHPRSRITGKLIIGGKEVPVKGEGYTDHQWGNIKWPDAIQLYYWGRIYTPNHTIKYFDAEMTEKYGYRRDKSAWLFKGDKPIEHLKDGFWVEASDIATEPMSGSTYAKKETLIFDTDHIKGTATYTVKHIMLKPRPGGRVGARGKPTGYMNFVSDCVCKFEIDGEKVESSGPHIHERAYWV